MYVVRKVLPTEYGKYRTHLKSLDLESRTLRFASPVTDEIIDQICDKVEFDTENHVLFAIENDKLEFIAVGHVALFDDMELAFSVHKDYQGHGLGNLLMKRVIQHCRTIGHLKGHMVCLPHNQAIKHLCTKHGIKIHTESGETLGDVDLPDPNVSTYVSEATDRNIAIMDFMAKRTMLPWTILSR